jgi:hypothetical protein
MSDETSEEPASRPVTKTARKAARKKAAPKVKEPAAAATPVENIAPEPPPAPVAAAPVVEAPAEPVGTEGMNPQVRRISHKPELPPRRDDGRPRGDSRPQDSRRESRDGDRREREDREGERRRQERGFDDEVEPIAFVEEPPAADDHGSNKRRRRRRKGKGGRDEHQGGEDRGPQAPTQGQGGQPQVHRRPEIDPEQVEKRAWKIFLAEVSEEGLALINDQDAKEISRRAFRLAELFLEEAARRQG